MVELVVGGGLCIVLIISFFFGGEVASGVATLLVAVVTLCLFVKYPAIGLLPVLTLICIGAIRWQMGKKKVHRQALEESTDVNDNNSGSCLLTLAGILLIFPTSFGMFFYFIIKDVNSSLCYISTAVCFIAGVILIGLNFDKAKAENKKNTY